MPSSLIWAGRIGAIVVLGLCTTSAGAEASPAKKVDAAAAIIQFKQQRLGPFDAVRWFCNDGTNLPPKAYACLPHGGGRQHGRWSAETLALRAEGLAIGNVLAAISPEQALLGQAELLKTVLVEQYLISVDNGWIIRRARDVRGVLQAEDEAASAARILAAMADVASYREQDWVLLREAFRRLPDPTRTSELDDVRAQASTLEVHDSGFANLRAKIHSRPEVSDAELVRKYANQLNPLADRAGYVRLADSLQRLFTRDQVAASSAQLAFSLKDTAMSAAADRLSAAQTPLAQLHVLADIQQLLRARIQTIPARLRMQLIGLSVATEEAAFVRARQWATQLAGSSRSERLRGLASLVRVLEGGGMLNARERAQALESIPATDESQSVDEYRRMIERLSRVPTWAANRLGYHFGPVLRRFSDAEPLASGYIPDRLRASPMLVFGEVLQQLQADADRLAGISHRFLGEKTSTGLRALNPGLARGELSALAYHDTDESARGIVLAPESVADLPPVQGILTANEGNALSHVQLLARNLGVPNVVVAPALIERLKLLLGQRLVVAVSAGGAVEIDRDGSHWDVAFPRQAAGPSAIQIDVKRLNLAEQRLLPLRELRAGDSGQRVGPKAAKLGELLQRYKDRVSPGLAIPFGRFRQVLDQRKPGTDMSIFVWMRGQYTRLGAIEADDQRKLATSVFLAEVRGLIAAHQFSEEFVTKLRDSMAKEFGSEGSYGVFVRSDTNVEDLPGFTGAGLNLTVPNVVGVDATLDAIRKVWASPFTERAFGWRQALMDKPEHVYTSVLLHKSVPGDYSGVMITADLASGDRGVINLATNEGVGGGVEGQAAESLRVDLNSGSIELLATAAEPTRRVLLSGGGSELVPASGSPQLLDAKAIEQLLVIARSLPERYPTLIDAKGQVAPADVEFAVADGTVFLNQIRPFLQSDRARRNAYLIKMDQVAKQRPASRVALTEPPQ